MARRGDWKEPKIGWSEADVTANVEAASAAAQTRIPARNFRPLPLCRVDHYPGQHGKGQHSRFLFQLHWRISRWRWNRSTADISSDVRSGFGLEFVAVEAVWKGSEKKERWSRDESAAAEGGTVKAGGDVSFNCVLMDGGGGGGAAGITGVLKKRSEE
ncbi:unnamed protein product [Lupinus luteus]|uniref:Uncharacterized protein n=1 Tax=Lupinus luteus TaxID=3873 RepID=A0AAV1VXE4_LUPLU